MLKRLSRTRTYRDERQHLLDVAAMLDPTSEQYAKVIDRIDKLDKIIKRSSEKVKTIVPSCITAASLVGIFVIQQYAGIVIPKALDMLPGRSTKEPNEKD